MRTKQLVIDCVIPVVPLTLQQQACLCSKWATGIICLRVHFSSLPKSLWLACARACVYMRLRDARIPLQYTFPAYRSPCDWLMCVYIYVDVRVLMHKGRCFLFANTFTLGVGSTQSHIQGWLLGAPSGVREMKCSGVKLPTHLHF